MEKFINFFSEHTIEQIESNGEFILKYFNLSDRTKLDLDFGRNFAYVKKIKISLNKIKEESKSSLQVLLCLQKIYTNIDDLKYIEIFRKLLFNSIYNDWTDNEKKYFDEVSDILINWKDFFLSYTNRNARETNYLYQFPIKQKLGHRQSDTSWGEKNYLAHVIAEYLGSNNLKAFFDIKNIKCGETIENEIEEQCRSAFCFVQLVQRELLVEEKGKKENWCFKEFNIFRENIETFKKIFFKENDIISLADTKFPRVLFFLLADESLDRIKPAKLPPQYQTWFDTMKATKNIALKAKEIRRIIDQIAEEIIDAKNTIIKTILALEPLLFND